MILQRSKLQRQKIEDSKSKFKKSLHQFISYKILKVIQQTLQKLQCIYQGGEFIFTKEVFKTEETKTKLIPSAQSTNNSDSYLENLHTLKTFIHGNLQTTLYTHTKPHSLFKKNIENHPLIYLQEVQDPD